MLLFSSMWSLSWVRENKARPPRFERGAFGSGGQRSIQLSYGRNERIISHFDTGIVPNAALYLFCHIWYEVALQAKKDAEAATRKTLSRSAARRLVFLQSHIEEIDRSTQTGCNESKKNPQKDFHSASLSC
jgi:hypothetical protein